MNENRCDLAEQHIAQISEIKARLKNVENQVSDLTDMKENLRVLTVLQQKQEERDNRFEEVFKEQATTNNNVTLTLQNINFSLKTMNEEIQTTNKKVEKLENKFEYAESLNKIDARNIVKDIILKFVLPVSSISFILYEGLKLLGVIK